MDISCLSKAFPTTIHPTTTSKITLGIVYLPANVAKILHNPE
jgi:hypothetical protein